LLRPGYFLVGYLLGGLISPATAVAWPGVWPLERWYRGLEFHSMHGVMPAFACAMRSSVGSGRVLARVIPTVRIFSRLLILYFLYGKIESFRTVKSPEILQREEFLIQFTIILCKIQHLNTRSSLQVLCCCDCTHFLKIYANHIVNIIMYLYRRWVRNEYTNMSEEFFFHFPVVC
jgi:hypothetical protein